MENSPPGIQTMQEGAVSLNLYRSGKFEEQQSAKQKFVQMVRNSKLK